MHKRLITFAIGMALVVTGILCAQVTSVDLTGVWELIVEEHGNVRIELKQEGTKISGRILAPEHGDLLVEGEFSDGSLVLHSKAGYMEISMTGALNGEGILIGKVTSTVGASDWTAYRIQTQKP